MGPLPQDFVRNLECQVPEASTGHGSQREAGGTVVIKTEGAAGRRVALPSARQARGFAQQPKEKRLSVSFLRSAVHKSPLAAEWSCRSCESTAAIL